MSVLQTVLSQGPQSILTRPVPKPACHAELGRAAGFPVSMWAPLRAPTQIYSLNIDRESWSGQRARQRVNKFIAPLMKALSVYSKLRFCQLVY